VVRGRRIPSWLLTMEQIGAAPSVRELLYKPRGLVLSDRSGRVRKNHHASFDDQYHQ